jgi:hypothetical protein
MAIRSSTFGSSKRSKCANRSLKTQSTSIPMAKISYHLPSQLSMSMSRDSKKKKIVRLDGKHKRALTTY